MVTLYGYNRCSTCRTARATLEQNGAQVNFIDLVSSPPSPDVIRTWLANANRPMLDFVNTKGTVYRDRDLKNAHFSEEQWIHELTRDGKLVKRPILVTSDGQVLIGYHEGTYRRVALADEGR